jgi:hypothetical protein
VTARAMQEAPPRSKDVNKRGTRVSVGASHDRELFMTARSSFVT